MITTITFFHFNQNLWWAFTQMGIFPREIRDTSGLRFFKMMGTGGGAGFSLRPDFKTYALLAHWDSQKEADYFFENSSAFQKQVQKSAAHRTLVLQAVHSHGQWDGQDPFTSARDPQADKAQGPVAVLTRATLRWTRLLDFWTAVPQASAAIKKAKGVLYYKGIGEWPFIQQATLSIWENFEAVKQFAYKDHAHATIVKKTRKNRWYKEDLFARFIVISDIQKK